MQDKPYICGKCGLSFSSAADLSSHMLHHMGTNKKQADQDQPQIQQVVSMAPTSLAHPEEVRNINNLESNVEKMQTSEAMDTE